ncbi:hypothetical protein I3842_16G110600 [Carya illinoinensis]|uniref:Uncharacterized protein n=1 Tax=Carya illinoinensis TaxID=32201 RepID=A0A922A957_CARIL|nr:hypothetical protein I3842_16G110600 [Carya illinoinensis]
MWIKMLMFGIEGFDFFFLCSTQRSVPASPICDSIVSWRKVLDPRSASTVSFQPHPFF